MAGPQETVTCLVAEDAINNGYIGADGRERQAQSSKKLTFRIVGISGELRVDDVDMCRVPTVDDERSENQPNSIKRDVDR